MFNDLKLFDVIKDYIESLDSSISTLYKIEIVNRVYKDLECLRVTNIMPTDVPDVYLIEIKSLDKIYFQVKNDGAYIADYEQLKVDYEQKLKDEKEMPF